jgi:hypothetical protein
MEYTVEERFMQGDAALLHSIINLKKRARSGLTACVRPFIYYDFLLGGSGLWMALGYIFGRIAVHIG